MTRYLTIDEILDVHRWVLQEFGGLTGIRDRGLLESALAAPQATFGGVEFHPSVIDKAAALAFSLVKNHAFVDGNKRVGFAAMDIFLRLHDLRVVCTSAEGETAFLALADGSMTRDQLTEWISAHCIPLRSDDSLPSTGAQPSSG